MIVYCVGVQSVYQEYEEDFTAEEKYFLKRESALKYREKLENDEDGYVKDDNNFETFFYEIDVIED